MELAQATNSSEISIERDIDSPMPECRPGSNGQTAPAQLNVRSVSKWQSVDETETMRDARMRAGGGTRGHAGARGGTIEAREIAPKVELRSSRLQFRFAIFAGECSKKYLARAGASEIIQW